MSLRRGSYTTLLVFTLIRIQSILAQHSKSHASYRCQTPGQKSLRTSAALDYALCKRNHEVYCNDCRCQFTAYLETAQSCMEVDEEYRIRVEETIAEWREHLIEMCPPPGFNPVTSPLPQYSLSPYDTNYCGASAMLTVNLWSLALTAFVTFAMAPYL